MTPAILFLIIFFSLAIGATLGAFGYHLYTIGEEEMMRRTGIDERC